MKLLRLFGIEPAFLCQFGGGGGGGDVAQPAPATPPVSPSSGAAVDVMQNLRRQQLRRKTISSTIKAGATGGWTMPPDGATSAGAPTTGGVRNKVG